MVIFYYFALIFPSLLVIWKFFLSNEKMNLPPSPLPLPIIGHLHHLKTPVYRSFKSLTDRYGPIVFLRLGSRTAVIVSSPSAVEECFTKNDIVLANRPRLIVAEHFGYNYTSVGWCPYGYHWRNLRRIMALEIFSPNRLQMYASSRDEEVHYLIRKLYQETSDGEFRKVDLKEKIFELLFNVVMRMVTGKRSSGKVMREMFIPGTFVSLADFFPFLRWLDLDGVEKNLVKMQSERDTFFQGLIDEHRCGPDHSSPDPPSSSSQGSNRRESKLIDVLSSLQESEPEYYTDTVVKTILQVMFTAGTETSSLTLEWAMTLLLYHPKVMEKVRAELEDQIGQGRLIDDSDLPRLPYLHCIINETLRLYPPAPILVPHLSSEECTIGGFDIPRETIIFVNAWAIHRDPNLWEKAMEFKPERFEGDKGEKRGFKFIPFGVGRRACPGEGLGMRIVALALGALIQCFEWETEDDEVAMNEGLGVTVPKTEASVAMCRPRQTMMNLLSQL